MAKQQQQNNNKAPETQEEMEQREVSAEEVEIDEAPRSDRELRAEEESRERDGVELERAPRDVKYEKIRETEVPDQIRQMFQDAGWNIRFVRFQLDNQFQNSYISKRMKEDKYDFVKPKELPEWYLSFFEEREMKGREDALTQGDVVLMKNPMDVKQQRQSFIQDKTRQQQQAVDANTLTKKKGAYSEYSSFVDHGSRSSVSQREPRFQD